MPTIRCRREIDVPAADDATIAEHLARLGDAERSHDGLAPDTEIEYSATLEVSDVVGTGRVLVVWTATFCVPDAPCDVIRAHRDAVFADAVDELRRRYAGAKLAS